MQNQHNLIVKPLLNRNNELKSQKNLYRESAQKTPPGELLAFLETTEDLEDLELVKQDVRTLIKKKENNDS